MLVNHSDIQRRFRSLAPFLDERMRRLVAASESEAIGYGGVSVVARATGVSRRAITEGMKELKEPKNAQRFGWKQLGSAAEVRGERETVDKDSSLLEDLDRLVDPVTRGIRNLRSLDVQECAQIGGGTPARGSRRQLSDGGRTAACAGLQPAGQPEERWRGASMRIGMSSLSISTARLSVI